MTTCEELYALGAIVTFGCATSLLLCADIDNDERVLFLICFVVLAMFWPIAWAAAAIFAPVWSIQSHSDKPKLVYYD